MSDDADRPAASPLRDLLGAAAREVASATEKMEQLYREAFVDTGGSTVHGLRRGTVVSTDDPLGRHRVEVSAAASPGTTAWAEQPLGADGSAPPEIAVGTAVWLAFEDGDPALPVVVGLVAG